MYIGKSETNMNEPMLLVIIVVVILSMTAILWRLIGCLQETAGLRFRSQDRERRDLYQTLERVLEWKEVPSHQRLDVSDRHRAERVNQVNADAIVEKSAGAGVKNKPPSPSKIYEAGQTAAEVGASYQ